MITIENELIYGEGLVIDTFLCAFLSYSLLKTTLYFGTNWSYLYFLMILSLGLSK